MYKTIVVGTDGSSTADGAVEHAIELASAHDASLHVVCVDNSAQRATSVAAAAGVPMPWDAGLDEAAAEHTRSVLDRAASLAGARGVDAIVHPSNGSPAETLVATAVEVRADLVVVGNRGMHGARRFLGSVPNHVAHHAPCAVLIVPTA